MDNKRTKSNFWDWLFKKHSAWVIAFFVLNVISALIYNDFVLFLGSIVASSAMFLFIARTVYFYKYAD